MSESLPGAVAAAPADPATAKPGFRISLAWRFFLFFAVLMGLVVGTALLVQAVSGSLVWLAGLALLLAAPAAYLLARATLRPLAAMSQAAQRAAAGDYSARMEVDTDDEFGELAKSFDALCSNLDERAALGAYAAAAARPATPSRAPAATPPPGDGTTAFPAVSHGTRTLLALDLRRFVEPIDPLSVAPVLASLADAVRRAVAVAQAQEGRLLTAGATRLVFGFAGEFRLPRALECMRLVLAEEPQVAAALLEGEAASGAIEFEPGASVSTLFGPASQQIERLLSESPPGTLLLPRGLGDAAKTLLGEAHVGVTQGLLSGKPFYSIVAADLAALPPPPPGAEPAGVNADAAASMRVGNRFELLAEIGRGPRGAIYKARDLEGGSIVQVELDDIGAPEAQAAAPAVPAHAPAPRFSHPNVIGTLAEGVHGGRAFRVTEYFPAPTLERALERCGRMPLAAALRLARQLCGGMQALHDSGMAHGDIRAGNILLGADGSVKLGRAAEGGTGATPAAGGATDTPANTGQGPELRADIHAFGVVLREAFDATLTGPAASDPATLASDAAAAAGFNALIRACVRAESGPQFGTTRELCAALEQIRA